MKFTYLNCEFFRLNDRSLQGLSPVENEKSCLINDWNFTKHHGVPWLKKNHMVLKSPGEKDFIEKHCYFERHSGQSTLDYLPSRPH